MMENKNGFFDILLFFLTVFAGLFVAQFLAVVCLLPFYDFDMQNLMSSINNPLGSPEIKMQLLFVQGVTSFLSFVVAPLVFIRWKEESVVGFLYRGVNTNITLILLSVVLMLVSIPLTSWMVEWNEAIKLPESLKSVEEWARSKEDFLNEMTKMLTRLNNPIELIVGLIVIALLPGLGEELVFRGYLQNKISRITSNPHVGIWVAAFLFSAIHFQFYGFFPRMFLGALFGYLYFITGQFHLPVVAHFTNNGLTLIMIYLKNKNLINYDIESEAGMPLLVGMVSLGITVGVFALIKSQLKEK